MHALLKCVFADYASELRVKYPTQKIRNAAVIASGVREFARLGFIELVDARKGIPAHVPEADAERVKRAKHQPIWIPSAKFPDWAPHIFGLMEPYVHDNAVAWKYNRSGRRTSPRWRAGMTGRA
jgi:hypothetical protein